MHDDRYLYLVKKLVSKTKRVGDCFIWTGALDRNGYGQVSLGPGKTARAHRLAALLFRSMPPDLYTLHKLECPRRACWNPEHTYDGTLSDNVRDSIRARTHNRFGRS